MTKPHVLLLGEIIHAKAEWASLSEVATLSVCDSSTPEEFIRELAGKYSDVTAVYHCPMNETKAGAIINKQLIEALPPSLKFICHIGAGYDMIDANELGKKGILLSNTPGTVDDATADVNMFLILGALREFNLPMTTLRNGNWNVGVPLSHDPEGQVLGILGMGGIGRAVKRRAEGFGMITQYHNRKPLSVEMAAGAKYVSFDELLATSDVISLNLPLNPHTRHIINKEAFAKMKDGVIIVNTARGAVIDEQALVDALDSGKVRCAGLDVFEAEPNVHPALIANENVILLPHVGTRTYETQKKMEIQAINNVRSAVTEAKLLDVVAEHIHLVP
ncbi:D-isomer specific 2-hydroxyacid dehydrogenase [Lipomyces kononenkoae]|uniref:D-isomer specific 2-hydroxyacid dehydrogenase n=1 Tax=Lipomyces kononenkoae TaxID=34357 RepID=A0ACC3SZ48_LIPKO